MTRAKKSYTAPTYDVPMRLVRLVHGVLTRPHGWSLDAVADDLRVSKRTVYRYVKILRDEFVDDRARPLIEEARVGERQVLRLAEHGRPVDSTAYEVAFFYFALSVFQFLDNTILKEGVEGLWERFAKGMPRLRQFRLDDFRRKFYTVPYAPKDYTAFDEYLDVIVKCLVFQRRMRIDYAGIGGEKKEHELEPYTLAMYRGGLYLIGRSSRARKTITLAVERIRDVSELADRFDYPKSYSPEKHTEGAFGIMAGDEPTEVELLIMDTPTLAYVGSRRLHPTQKLRTCSDGKALLSMTVRGTDELRNWLMSFGPHIKVLKPASLARELRDLHGQSVELYGA